MVLRQAVLQQVSLGLPESQGLEEVWVNRERVMANAKSSKIADLGERDRWCRCRKR